MRILHLERLNKLLKLAGKNLKFQPKVRSVDRPSQVRSALCICPPDPTGSEKVIHTPLEPRWDQKADRLISNHPGQSFFLGRTPAFKDLTIYTTLQVIGVGNSNLKTGARRKRSKKGLSEWCEEGEE